MFLLWKPNQTALKKEAMGERVAVAWPWLCSPGKQLQAFLEILEARTRMIWSQTCPPPSVGHGSISTGKLSRTPDRNPREEWRFCFSISPTTRALSQNLLITGKGSFLITLATANLGSRGKHPWKWVPQPQPRLGLEFFTFAPLLCLHPLEGTKSPLSSCVLSFGLL